MNGILFAKTQQLKTLREFYTVKVDCSIWLEQPDCIIFQHGNFLFGFCQRDGADAETGFADGLLTFFYPTREQVDSMYDILKPLATTEPSYSDKYQIYQFFAKDPDGRGLEFQWFDHPLQPYQNGSQLLQTRRSVREYLPTPITDTLFRKVIGQSRWAPTAYNRQAWYVVPITDAKTLETLAESKGDASAPIGRAPMAVAIVSDPDRSPVHIQDGCIAATYFLLAAWNHGLGTCWLGDFDQSDVKKLLNIPDKHYLVTVTPLGFPADPNAKAPERKSVDDFIGS